MSFARKIKRKNYIDDLKAKGLYCCGFPMNWKTLEHNEILFVCEKCGRVKFAGNIEVTKNDR